MTSADVARKVSTKRPRLLFIYLEETSFVRDDLVLLSEAFEVVSFQFDAHTKVGTINRGVHLAQSLVRQYAWLKAEIRQADLIYGWFADYHMVLPLLAGRWFDTPLIIMLGGMDCNHLPEYSYGTAESLWRAPISRFLMRRADHLIAPDKSLRYWSSSYSRWPDGHTSGLEHQVGTRHAPLSVIPLGFESADWPIGHSERDDVVITVAYFHDMRSFKVKGGDHFVAAARKLPDVTFRMVGVETALVDRLKTAVPENVELRPPCSREKLSAHYREASVYAQLSRIESFGMVVGEAMLSGCIPVVSSVGALPSLAGPEGFVVDYPIPGLIAETLRNALRSGADRRASVRDYIIEAFPLEQRRVRLTAVLNRFAGES